MTQSVNRAHPIGNQLIREGSPTIGVYLHNLFSPNIARILAAAGADYLMLDLERTTFTAREVEGIVAGAKSTTIPVIVRPPEVTRNEIGRLLDLGVDGILAPRVGTPEQAQAAVRYTKFEPIGDRGTEYDLAGGQEGMAAINRGTLLMTIAETADSVENIEAICTTPGIDAVWIGPVDLSASLGVLGDFESEVYRNAEDRLVEACKSHGMPFGIGAVSTPEHAVARIEQGCFSLFADDEVTFLQRAVSTFVADVRTALGPPDPTRRQGQ